MSAPVNVGDVLATERLDGLEWVVAQAKGLIGWKVHPRLSTLR